MRYLNFRNLFYFLIILSAAVFYFKFITSASFILDGRRFYTLFDDAMISMRYARNFAEGNGLVWNLDEHVEGYTNFLWVIWMSILHLFPFHESKMSMLVSLSGLIILILNIMTVKSITARVSKNSFLTVSIAMIFSAFYFGLIYWTLRGMEVGLLTLLSTYSLLLLLRFQDAWSEKDFIKFMITLSVILLLRTDSFVIVFFFLLCFYFTIKYHGKKNKFKLAAIVIILLIIAQTLFRWIYYDDFLPNTYYLKLGGTTLYDRLYRGWDSFVNIFTARLFPLILPIILFLIFYYRQIDKRKFFPLAGLFTVTSLYSIYIGGDSWEWMPYANRFITVGIPAVIILFAVSINKIFYDFKAKKIFLFSAGVFLLYILIILFLYLHALPEYDFIKGKVWMNNTIFFILCLIYIAVMICTIVFPEDSVSHILLKINTTVICIISFFIINEYSYSVWFERNAYFVEQDTNNAKIGLILNSKTNDNTKIADLWAGNAPYFSKRYFVDLLGKMDKHIAREKPSDKIFLPGHSKWDHLYSIKEYKPDIILSLKENLEGELKQYLTQYYTQKTPPGWYFKKGTDLINRF